MSQTTPQPAPTCPRCSVGMERGFCIDHVHSDIAVKQERWVAGDPRPSTFWTGTETGESQKINALRVFTFRCPKCGYLESYAPPQS